MFFFPQVISFWVRMSHNNPLQLQHFKGVKHAGKYHWADGRNFVGQFGKPSRRWMSMAIMRSMVLKVQFSSVVEGKKQDLLDLEDWSNRMKCWNMFWALDIYIYIYWFLLSQKMCQLFGFQLCNVDECFMFCFPSVVVLAFEPSHLT